MNPSQYKSLALKTLNSDLTTEQKRYNAQFGLAAEYGELTDIFKKHLFQKHDLDKEACIKEIGDILWYSALCCSVMDAKLDKIVAETTWSTKIPLERSLEKTIIDTYYAFPINLTSYPAFYASLKTMLLDLARIGSYLDTTLEEAAKKNIEKLNKRYKGGAFSKEKSIFRSE
tara:strand:+ start:7186 stop:7701 length:516 start_codon:yes stop_codon:yes gene_type:complete